MDRVDRVARQNLLHRIDDVADHLRLPGVEKERIAAVGELRLQHQSGIPPGETAASKRPQIGIPPQRRAAVHPVGIHPRMKFKIAAVRLLHHEGERVERPVTAPLLPGHPARPGVEFRRVEGVAHRPHLKEDRVEVRLAQILHQLDEVALEGGRVGVARKIDVLNRRHPDAAELPAFGAVVVRQRHSGRGEFPGVTDRTPGRRVVQHLRAAADGEQPRRKQQHQCGKPPEPPHDSGSFPRRERWRRRRGRRPPPPSPSAFRPSLRPPRRRAPTGGQSRSSSATSPS